MAKIVLFPKSPKLVLSGQGLLTVGLCIFFSIGFAIFTFWWLA